MIKSNALLVCLFFFLFFNQLYAQSIDVEGVVLHCKQGDFFLIDVDALGQNDTLAKTKVNDSKCSFKCQFPKNRTKKIATLTYVTVHENGSHSGFFFLENRSKFTFKIQASGLVEYEGSKNAEKINSFYATLNTYQPKLEKAMQEKNEAELNQLKSNLNKDLYNFTKENIDSDLTEVALVLLLRTNEIGFLNTEDLSYYHDVASRFASDIKIAAVLKQSIEAKKTLKVGAKAPDFMLPNEKGDEIALKNIKTDYILLDFWATWCGPCIKGIPKVKEINKKYPKIQIIGISQDKDADIWKKFLKKQENNWINLIDNKLPSVSGAYLALAIPYYVLLDKDRKIVVLANSIEEVELFLKK